MKQQTNWERHFQISNKISSLFWIKDAHQQQQQQKWCTTIIHKVKCKNETVHLSTHSIFTYDIFVSFIFWGAPKILKIISTTPKYRKLLALQKMYFSLSSLTNDSSFGQNLIYFRLWCPDQDCYSVWILWIHAS